MSYPRPTSASTVRLGCAGIERKPPTLVGTVAAAKVNEPDVLPLRLIATWIVEGAEPPEGVWYVTATRPLGPTAISPKLPFVEPGTDSARPNAPRVPKAVAVAPR